VQVTSGIMTLLFTDIEGSTRLWEQQAERMSQALARHDALSRSAVEDNHGFIVKMTGDGMYAAFEDPADAVNAALTLQRALLDPASTNGVPLLLRYGLHTGVVERRNDDLFGSPVNRAARIMKAAHGGQILVSQAVFDNVRERLPSAVTLRDLGAIRLRDLATPEHVFQLVHPDLRQDFPALRSLAATPNNLPQQITSFIGRERELDEAKRLLAKTRLLTLFGMGGLGKTRLSLQIGADVIERYPDGVWFVDLAPIRDPALIPNETAQVLGVREEPGKPLVQTLSAHLKDRELLLILDNCEHHVSACASLANALLRAAPMIRVLATSREALRVPGEQTYPVFPLTVPDRSASVETLSRSDAVQLFIERARLQKPGFSLTEKEAPAIAELCTRVEGIPLALELAAARMRSLSVADINTRLRDRFKLLTGGGRVLLERQQTLRALVDWSYDQLPENEQILFDRLSVFAGGFELPAAEEVCGVEPLTPEDVLDLLASLVDKSLVMPEETDDGTRYRTLETIRDYARVKLIERGELQAASERHCNYYFVMAKAGNRGLQGAEQPDWIRRLEAELDNLRAAIAYALEGGGDPIIAVKIEVALQGFRILRGYATEGRGNVRAMLALPAIQAMDIAKAHTLYVGAALADSQSDDWEAERMLETCLALRRDIGNQVDIAATLSTLAAVRLRLGDATRARAGETEALAIFRQLGDRSGEAIALLHLGEVCVHTGADDEAREFLEQSLAIAREVAYQETESDCERMLGQIALENSDLAAARGLFGRALEVCTSAGNKRGAAVALWWLGKVDIATGDTAAAQERLGEALRSFQSFEMNAEMLGCLEDHARLARSLGFAEEAVRLYAAVAAVREKLVLPRPPRSDRRWRDDVEALRHALGDAAFDAAWADGQRWEIKEAVRRALAPAGTVTTSA
jgi:predicted ATPase/class 3 adenylate cyclase